MIPNENAISVFSKDYEFMKKMIYGIQPTFHDMIITIKEYETVLNRTLRKRYDEKQGVCNDKNSSCRKD